jgi:hypothetical protein
LIVQRWHKARVTQLWSINPVSETGH